jgi:hypothetical protein
VADYRANNRNTKAVDLARVRAAANYKVPMYPDLPAALQRRKELLAVQAGLTTNEMGVRYLDEQTSAGKKLDAAVNAMPTSALLEGLGGAFNLVTNKFNPENRKYPDKQVPLKIFGYDVSGGKQTVTQPHQSPNMWTALGAIPGVIGRSVMAPERTDQQNKLWEQARGNPREYMRLLKGLNPAQQAQNSIDTKIKSDEKDYNDMVSMLKDTGISEEELYRGVVVGPDGQINLNANTQAAIDGLGYAGSSLRLTELIGYGLGKPVGMAARAATKAAIPRAVGLATNPRLITAGQATLETLQRGGRPSEAVLGGVAALVAGNKPVSAVGTLGAWNPGATSKLGGLTKAQQEIESVVGKSLDEIKPNDWVKLIEEDPKLVVGATHRPRRKDSNYGTNLAKRLAYNKLPSNIKARFSGKVPYDDWWKQLSESEKDFIKANHEEPTIPELQGYSMELLNDATQIDGAGNLVWKDGGKDLFYSQHDLAHANPEGLPSVPGTDILGWQKRNTNTSEGYKIGAGRK